MPFATVIIQPGGSGLSSVPNHTPFLYQQVYSNYLIISKKTYEILDINIFWYKIFYFDLNENAVMFQLRFAKYLPRGF